MKHWRILMAYLLGRGLGKEESPPVDTVIFMLCKMAISGQGWKISMQQ